MTKSSFGVMDAQHKFAPALCFRLLMENFLMVTSSCGTTTKKAMKRVTWPVLEEPWKHHLSQSRFGLCYDWFTFRVSSSHTEICPINKKCLFTWYLCPERAWEHQTGIQRDSRNPQDTSCGKVWSERGIWLKDFWPSRVWVTFLYPMVLKQEKCCHLRVRNCRYWW